MKTTLPLTLTTVALITGAMLSIAGQIAAGPKGGRLLEKTEPRAEFQVGKDRAVTLAFYDARLKPVPVASQSVTVVAEGKSGRTTLEFEKKGDTLVSTGKLPEGDGYMVVVQLKSTPEAKPQNFRFRLDLHLCGGCKLAEYACTCGH